MIRPVVAAVLAALVLAPTPAGAEDEGPTVQRVLVLSLPTVSWGEVNDAELPHLDALLDESAIAGLSTRAVDRRTTPGDGYTTISAGTRADGVADFDGLAFEVGERYLGSPADQVFTRRTGTEVTSGLFSLALPALVDRNEGLDFDAEVGALGDALVDGGAHPAVIANADGAEEESDLVYGRAAVNGFITSTGVVEGGRVGPDLLEQDPTAPFGRRLDNDEVVSAFDAVWDRPGSVVMVEASDVVRADAYAELTTDAQHARQRAAALSDTDELLGRLLGRVDPERDAVLVIGPYHARSGEHLTVAALRAPRVEPGLMRSAVTRRSGFVTLVDVAPTILDLLDLDIPDSMEGRPFERSATGGSAAERRDWLADADEAAQWRDSMVTPVAVAFVLAQLVLWVLAVWALARGRRPRAVVERAALSVLAVLPLTYLAQPLPFHEWGAAAYWGWLIVGGAVLGCGAQALFRRWPADPLIAVLALIYLVLCLDVMTGGRLQLNTVFGYTPTVAGRFAGLGNLAFAQLAAASTILAGLLASRVPGRRGAILGVSVVGVALVIDGSPFWGSDVGGALTLVPTLAGVAVVLFHWRFRLRTAAVVALGTVVVFVVAGMIDLARPEESRTHLGRLFEDIGSNGVEAFETVVVRKIGENVAVLASSEWTLMLPIVFAFILYLIWRAPWRLQQLQQVLPGERAARVGFVIAATLGFAFNDSGIAVPGLMLGVMNASLVYLVLRCEDPPWCDQIAAASEICAG